MKFFQRLLPAFVSLCAAGTPATAAAQDAHAVIGILTGGDTTALNLGQVLLTNITGILSTELVEAVAILMIVIAGISVVVVQNDSQLEKAKNTIIAAGVALLMLNFWTVIQSTLLDVTNSPSEIQSTASSLMGIIESFAGAIALITIIISGIRAIATFGTDSGATELRRAVLSSIVGVLLMAHSALLADVATGAEDVTSVIDILVNIANVVLSFMGLAAFVVLVVGGIQLVVLDGERKDQVKGLVIRVIIGFILILLSAGLVNLVIA